MTYVAENDAALLLDVLDDASVSAIITSPPFQGLPGRGSTHEAVRRITERADRLLTEDGSIILIVGASFGYPILPFDLAVGIEEDSRGALDVAAWYIWDRSGTMRRDTGRQVVTADVILHVARTGTTPRLLHSTSVIRTNQPGFDYGDGVTTPADLAAWLVHESTQEGDLVVDPFAGLGEIGVQAVAMNRRFIGSDLDASYVRIANARIANAERG
jgi:hypothetical protein